MAKRFDVVAPKKYTKNGEEKTQWNKIGTVWQDGDKMRLNLDLVPTGWDGFALISEPKPMDGASLGKQQGSTPSGQSKPDPFADDDFPAF